MGCGYRTRNWDGDAVGTGAGDGLQTGLGMELEGIEYAHAQPHF